MDLTERLKQVKTQTDFITNVLPSETQCMCRSVGMAALQAYLWLRFDQLITPYLSSGLQEEGALC